MKKQPSINEESLEKLKACTDSIAKKDIKSTLGELPQWVNWIPKKHGDKIKKMPLQLKSSKNASVTNPDHWSTLAQVEDSPAYKKTKRKGFVFTKDDPYLFIDLDHVLTPEGTFKDTCGWAEHVVEELASYTEVSPSGDGLHIFCKAPFPEGLKNKTLYEDGTALEIYSYSRYSTVTEKIFNDYDEVKEVPTDILFHYADPVAVESAKLAPKKSVLSVDEVITKLKKGGHWSGYDTSDQSSADMSLANHIAFFCNGDYPVFEKVFLQHPFGKRDKASKRKDYLPRTFDAVMENKKQFYTGKKKKEKDNAVVRGVVQPKGEMKYVILNKGKLHFTNKPLQHYLLTTTACADILNAEYGMGIRDKDGWYSKGLTIKFHINEVDTISIINNPFTATGLIEDDIYNIGAETRFNPVAEEANEIVKSALAGFDNDFMFKDVPITLVYLSFMLFHHEKIMASVFTVHPKRGVGKSTWLLDIPSWFYPNNWSMMDNGAIKAGWDDEKLGVRGLCYEDIENLDKKAKDKFIADLKSDSTAGHKKKLNIKTLGKAQSFGHNIVGTTNHRTQIPLDGIADRRIHVLEFNPVEDPELSGAFNPKFSGDTNLKNAINYLYSIYVKFNSILEDRHSGDRKELYNYLYTAVPKTAVKDETARGNLPVGKQMGLALLESKSLNELYGKLQHLVSVGKDHLLLQWVEKLDLKRKGVLDVTDSQLLELYRLTPVNRNKGLWTEQGYTKTALIRIFGLEDYYPKEFIGLKIRGTKFRGARFEGYNIDPFTADKEEPEPVEEDITEEFKEFKE